MSDQDDAPPQLKRRLTGGVAVSAVIAAAVAVAFGTGFTASRTVLAEGGAWLSSGRTVTHVNAGTGRSDATVDGDLVGEAGDQEVVTSTSGTAVVDAGEGTVTSLDTTTMTTGATAALPEGADRPGFVVAGRFGYLIGDTVVQPVDPVTLQEVKPAIGFGHVGGAVATAEGTLVVLDTEAGTAVEVVDGVERMPASVSRRRNAEHLALTAVSGRPVVVDTRAGTVLRLEPGGAPEDPIRVEGLAGLAIDDVAVADPHADGSTVWLVRRSDGRLLGIDLDGGHVRSGPLDRRGASLQSPVVLEGLVYVPSGDSHDVTVIDGTSDELHLIDRHEPDGSSSRLEVFAHEGRVWINDPAAPQALVVEANGRDARVVDKGTGRDVGGSDEAQPGSSAQPAPGTTPLPGVPDVPAAPPSSSPDVDLAQVEVPRVVGLDRVEACGQIQAAQLVCDDRPVPDAPGDTEGDEVVGQDPSGGRAPVLSAVVVEYYAPGGVEVPGLDGLRVGQGGDPRDGPACLALVQAGYGCAPRAIAAADGQPADEVIPASQQPEAGSDDVAGDDVTFQYSTHARVPTLTGLTEQQACRLVNELNLSCDVQDTGIGATPGQVSGQTPAPGTEAPADSPVRRSEVTIQVPQRTSVVPLLSGVDQATACAALAAEQLGCSWEVNPTNSIRNPGLADAQSIAAGTPAAPGTVVSVYHPAGPDATLWRYRARHTGDERFWAMAPDQGPGQGIYNATEAAADRWARNGTVGRCYSTRVEGSVPLYGFKRQVADDGDPAFHFYAAGDPGSIGYQRGLDFYPPSEGGKVQLLCYVVPSGAVPDAVPVAEWTKTGTAGHHFYTATNEASPGPLYQSFPSPWMTW